MPSPANRASGAAQFAITVVRSAFPNAAAPHVGLVIRAARPGRRRPLSDTQRPQPGRYGATIKPIGLPIESCRMPAPNLKTLEGCLEVRRRILGALEAAELEPDPRRRSSWLTFVVVGAGPTGVEMAGQIAEIAQDVRAEFRSLDSSQAQILLVETGDRILQDFPPSLA